MFKARLKYSKELFDYNVKIQKLTLLIIRVTMSQLQLVPTFEGCDKIVRTSGGYGMQSLCMYFVQTNLGSHFNS